MKSIILISITLFLACNSVVYAENKGFVKEGSKRSITLPEPIVSLKDGPGVDAARGYCSICHSLDYITTQPKFPKAKWQAEVTKMIKVYGAPVPDESAKAIADYIASHYGSGESEQTGLLW